MTFKHAPMFPLGADQTPYRKLTSEGVTVETFNGAQVLSVSAEALRLLAETAMMDINHLLRPGHLAQLAKILDDPEATGNDRFVAYDLLKNANIAAGGVLPMCQDTGTAIIMGKKGRLVWTQGGDEAALAQGIRDAYEKKNLRYSQLSPVSMFEEKNTKNNLPAQIDIYAEGESDYKFLFMAKGGGSANKTFLFQQTPSVLTHDRMIAFLKEKILTLGTAACPPYHLAIVIGGLSAEQNLKTVKLASARYLDDLPTSGGDDGHAFRDLAMEEEIHKMTQKLGVGAPGDDRCTRRVVAGEVVSRDFNVETSFDISHILKGQRFGVVLRVPGNKEPSVVLRFNGKDARFIGDGHEFKLIDL